MIYQPVFLEPYEFKLYKAKPNSAFEMEEKPCLTFRGKFANPFEKRTYRVVKGVNSIQDNTLIMSTRLPSNIEPNDKIEWGTHVWIVESVGVYVQDANLLNANNYSEDSIFKRSPKGISLI